MEIKVIEQNLEKIHLVKYKDKWYYYNNGKYFLWINLVDIDWNILTTQTRRIFHVPVDSISPRQAKKMIKEFSDAMRFPNDDKFQKKINNYVRKEKLVKIENYGRVN